MLLLVAHRPLCSLQAEGMQMLAGMQMLGLSAAQDVASEPNSGAAEDHVTLVSFARPGTCITSGTPFAGKMEVALRLAGIEYTGYTGDITNKKHAPKGKVRLLLPLRSADRAVLLAIGVSVGSTSVSPLSLIHI